MSLQPTAALQTEVRDGMETGKSGEKTSERREGDRDIKWIGKESQWNDDH